MKRVKFVLLAICIMLFCGVGPTIAQTTAQGSSAESQEKELKEGETMPEFVLESSVYGNVNSKDLKGKVVLVSLFATWCGPCQVELAEIEKSLWPKFKNNKNFKFIVIGREHTDEELAKYNEKKGFTFPLYPDPERKAYAQFADKTIPRAYLFGKDGKLIHASKGYKPGDVNELIEMIEKAL